MTLIDSIGAAEGGAILRREGSTLNLLECNERMKKDKKKYYS